MQLDQAKILLMQDVNYKKDFKFDHVWNIVKNFEKFKDDVQTARQVYLTPTSTFVSSESDNPTPEYHLPESPNLSDFPINLNDEDASGSSSKRPIGVKKAKSKRKMEEKAAHEISVLREENQQLFNMMKKSTEDRQAALEIERNKLEIQRRKLYLKEVREENKLLREENKLMCLDLDRISDPNRRAFIAAQQEFIMQRRSQSQVQPPFIARQHQQPQLHPQPQPPPPPSQTNIFAAYFPNISGGGSDLPDY